MKLSNIQYQNYLFLFLHCQIFREKKLHTFQIILPNKIL